MELLNNTSLKSFVTFGVEATCDHLYRVEDIEELKLAAQFLENPLILGGGSNILPVGDIHRNILKIELKGIEIEGEDERDPLIHVAGGEIWHQVVLWAIEKDLGGIENLSLIPGTIGASPIQNIGAYGVELESVFHSLLAVEIGTGKVRRFTKEECRFGYRDSIFKQEARGKYIIVGVTLRLTRDHKLTTSYGAIQDMLKQDEIANPTIRDVSNAVIKIRQSKLPDPAKIGNAGSFFKNPFVSHTEYNILKELFPGMPAYPSGDDGVKLAAGWLIEQAGWKGKHIGNAGCYDKQALVLVNLGNAKGTEVMHLAEEIIESVNSKFNVRLSPEVNIWE